ncbi:DEAD/DEAH box helicase [Pedobacter sp. UYP30]|uniref:DEAD/DEAH box helicase n=1 Tax=Pedobacter sp. UYP30 TaxID=1756400 RepID=UPI00339B697F
MHQVNGGESQVHPFDFVIDDFNLRDLTDVVILKYINYPLYVDERNFLNLAVAQIEVDFAAFADGNETQPPVLVVQSKNQVTLSCRCGQTKKWLCTHQSKALYNILKREELRIFFDDQFRKQKIKTIAFSYGLENELRLDDFFEVQLAQSSYHIKPKAEQLIAFGTEEQEQLKAKLLPLNRQQHLNVAALPEHLVLVFAAHKHFKSLTISIFEAQHSKSGKLKNPIKVVSAAALAMSADEKEHVKFYSAAASFEQNFDAVENEQRLGALKIVVKNPLGIRTYLQDDLASGNSQKDLQPLTVKSEPLEISLLVEQKGDFFEITGSLIVNGKAHDFDKVELKLQYFVSVAKVLYLIPRLDFLRVIDYFRKQGNRLALHKSRYPEFQKSILIPLETSIKVDYAYLKPATKTQIEEKGFDLEEECCVYLSESEDFVLITPVMVYGNIDVPVLSRKQIQATDKLGKIFTLGRNEKKELQLIADVLKQHPYFYEQEPEDSFYLHKKRFLEIDWFLDAFEAWRSKGIQIFGFNQLKNNKLNSFKADINIEVLSGTDWFETKMQVKFGKQQVALKHLHKSIRNKSKFVSLDDGTQGIIPEAWIDKFADYFAAGDVVDDVLLIPKIRYNAIEELYEGFLLDEALRDEVNYYKKKINAFDKIVPVEIPKMLTATLRGYQHEGLNWLNFLDNLNFGGCLADDMGLGKTIQILAFFLAQREKLGQVCNLVVVPASLIFNWKEEIEKFAPSLIVKVLHGNERKIEVEQLSNYEVVLTSYGTLLSDINLLKNFKFNYVVLDESQNIKNPSSQRYKAVKLLQARNRIVLSGTPIENNTFDLYGQLSFACPGLFGSKQHFADLYSTPIDQFSDGKRTAELQKLIKPFILRRTKEQVAKELPEKTEIVLYCEMGAEQREVYEANKKEIQDYLLGKDDESLQRSTIHVLKSITKLRQICNSAELLGEGKSYVQASSKIEVLLEQIEAKAGQHKILVFSQFVGMLNLIKKQLEMRNIGFEMLTGQTRNRAEVVNAFQSNKKKSVFLISLKAGGTGLNLTEADYVYLVDPWWNPAVENQAIDRAHRIGQQKNVMAVRLICPNTIEEKIRILQTKKKDLVNNLFQTDGGFFKNLSKTELLGLLE